MTAGERTALEALKRATGDDGAIHTATLPAPVTDAMQTIVDRCEFRCLHVAAGDGLPAAVVPKLAIRGVPGLWCSRPTCVADMAQHVAVWRGVRIDDRCVLCDRQPTVYRTSTTFRDEAVDLTLVAWVCRACTGKLAAWVGLP